MAPNCSIPCTLCGRSLEQREDKNGKPYFVCDECGTQFFIRGTAGKERLTELLRRSKTKDRGDDTKPLIQQLEQIQNFIETFDDGQLVFPDEKPDSQPVPFPDWTKDVFGRASDRIRTCAGLR